MIKVVDVHKSFGKLHVLKGINFNVSPGSGLVIGPSGPGKAPSCAASTNWNRSMRDVFTLMGKN